MPNWCENRLDVKGPSLDLARFQAAARAKQSASNEDHEGEPSELSFESHLPAPARFYEPSRDSDGSGGDRFVRSVLAIAGMAEPTDLIGWRNQNWGTKWDLSDVRVSELADDTLRYEFETAWAPPVPWLESVAKLYPTLDFELFYAEAGCGFCGRYRYRGDDCLGARELGDLESGQKYLSEHGIGWWDYYLDEIDESGG